MRERPELRAMRPVSWTSPQVGNLAVWSHMITCEVATNALFSSFENERYRILNSSTGDPTVGAFSPLTNS